MITFYRIKWHILAMCSKKCQHRIKYHIKDAIIYRILFILSLEYTKMYMCSENSSVLKMQNLKFIKIRDTKFKVYLRKCGSISRTSRVSVASSLNVLIVAPLFGNLETDRFCDNYSLLLKFIQSLHLLHWKMLLTCVYRCYVKDTLHSIYLRIRYNFFIKSIHPEYYTLISYHLIFCNRKHFQYISSLRGLMNYFFN